MAQATQLVSVTRATAVNREPVMWATVSRICGTAEILSISAMAFSADGAEEGRMVRLAGRKGAEAG
ncbi:hypothetical protein Xcc1_21280 [Xanthomonas campestris pv. campestris]|nr:hypothetical protein Xcc1_21280 [Xanthomonas campestris pv. campestris]